jgi:acetyltransferase-like isoleucine patch superfamily enzyme
MIPIEVVAFKNFINKKKINLKTYFILIIKIPFDLIEFIIRYIPGPIGFYIRRYYYKIRCKSVGSNVFIDVGVHFIGYENISLDNFVYIDKYCLITALSKLEIGKRVHVGSFSIIHAGINGEIKISDYVGLSANTKMYSSVDKNVKDKRLTGPMILDSEKVPRGKPIILEKDSWIGPNCLILPGVKIGYGAIISPFTIIKKNINPLSIVDNNGNKSKDRDFSL